MGFKRYLSIFLLVSLALVSLSAKAAPIPSTNLSDLPGSSFAGEQFCFDAPLINLGDPGFGPYLRLQLPPEVSFDSATFVGISVSSQDLGTFPPDITDPLTDEVITGPDGYTVVTLSPPLSSIVSGGPTLNINICSTIDVAAPLGDPLLISLQPVFQFGDTATGENGAISGTEISANVTPSIVKFEKSISSLESENAAGSSWPITYQLTADIASGKTLFDLNFEDILPTDLQYVANTISIVGGTTCVPSVIGQSIIATCSEATGTVVDNDVVVSFEAYIKDVLDETQCSSQPITNTATFNANRKDALNNDIALGEMDSAETVSAQHIVMQKFVSPGVDPNFVSPGDILTYTVNMQVSDFGNGSSLVFNDVLPDGIGNFVHSSLSLNGSSLAITPNVTNNGDGTTSISYDIGAVAGGTVSSGSNISLVYTAAIQQSYQSGDVVKANDVLVNSAESSYSMGAGATNCSNSSSASATIKPLILSKEIVNPKAEYIPGEVVTFRLTMQVPSGDTADIVFEDFFPLPVFDVSNFTTTTATYGGIGSAADIRRAATDTLGLTPSSISINSAANKLEISWPDINSTSAQVLAVEVDAVVSSDPFSDSLSLTNLFQASTKNSPLAPTVDLSLTTINVRSPELTITKGVLSSNNGNSTISPAPGSPVDGNLTDADAQDIVTFELTVENTGGAAAYDVNISDDLGLPANLLSGCAIVSVEDGTGTALAYTSASTFDGNLSLDNPLAANDGNPVNGGAPYAGDTAIIQISCNIAPTVESGTTITNTSSVTWASGTGDATFPSIDDDATITISDPNITKTLVGGPTFTIGDIIRYDIVITVPELTISNVVLNDTLDSGLAFVDFTNPTNASITNSSGVSNSVFSADVTNSGSTLELDLGTIANTNTGNNGTDIITISYDVVVLNTTDNDAGDTKNNAVNLTSDSYDSATVRANNITITEPNVIVDKTVITSGPYDAGDTVTYDWYIRQSGTDLSDAFEVILNDTLPENVTYTAGTLAAVGACPNLVLDDSNANGSPATLNASWSSFAVNQECHVRYSVTLDNAVVAGTDLINVVDIAWSSLAGTISGPLSIYNNNSCERTGSDPNFCGSGNDYDYSANASVSVSEVEIKKLLISTSETVTGQSEYGSGRHDLAIGETVTYSLTVTFPQGISQDVIIRDNLPANANGVMEYVSSNMVSVGANLSPDLMPTAVVTDQRLGDGINDRVEWSFGQVVNGTTDGVEDDNDRIVIEVTGRLVDTATNVASKRPRNNSLVRFGTGLRDSSIVTADTVEPKLEIDKSSTTTTADGGDSVNFILDVRHTSASSQEAFDVVVQDIIPTGLMYVPGTFQLIPSATCSVTPVLEDSDPQVAGLTATFDNLPQADICQIEFDATLDSTVNPNQTIVNVANLTWDSLPADNDPNERDYATSDDHEIKVTKPGLSKIVFATSETSTNTGISGPEEDLTIGEKVTYRFTATMSEGETEDVVIVDQLPTIGVALKYESSRIVSIGSQITLNGGYGLNDAGDDCLSSTCDLNSDTYRDIAQWNIDSITNTPDGISNSGDQIVFEVIAVVIDVSANAGGADDLINTATMNFSNDGGNPITGTVAVDVVEPVLTISKEATPTATPYFADAGDVISFEMVVTHDTASNAEAFNINIEDTLANNGAVALMETFTNLGGTCGATADTSNAANTPFKVNFAIPSLSLATGSCTITYDVTVSTSVSPGQTIKNIAALQYDSTPVYEMGETRRSTDTAEAEIVINAPSLVKSVSGTSLADTGHGQHDGTLEDLTIGELVTYSITMKFPEGTTNNVLLTDTMPTGAGGVIQVVGTPVFALGANVSTTDSTVSINSDNDGFIIDFGTVTNSPDNTDSEADLITVTVTGVVVDDSNNVDAKQPSNSATFTYTGGTPLTDTADVELVEPQMVITKSMSIDNGVATITVNLKNTGTAGAYDIEIEDVLDSSEWNTSNITPLTVPTGFTLTTSAGPNPTETTVVMASDTSSTPPVNSIEPDETKTFQFTAPVVPGVASINNTAINTQTTTVSGTDANEREKPPVSGSATLGIPLIELSKSAAVLTDTNNDNEVGGVGDIITYNFTVKNTGGVALSNVVVTDTNPAVTVTGNPISLAVGATDSTTIKGTYMITQTDMNLGTFENTAKVTANGPTGTGSTSDDSDDPNNNINDDVNGDGEPDDPTIVTLPRNPRYTMTKTANPTSLSAPGTITYTFTFNNTGNVGLTNLTVTDVNIDPNTLVCNGDGNDDDAIDAIGVGGTQTCSATRAISQPQIDAGTALTNTAIPTATDLDGVTAVTEDDTANDNSTSTTVSQSASYTMTKTVDQATISAPGTLTYTFTFRNTGNVSIKNLTVTDGNIDPNTLACNGDGNDDGAIDTIGVGGSQTCTATRAISQPQIDAGTALTNTAIPTAMGPDGITAVAEDDTANDNSTSTTVFQSASYTMTKTVDQATISAPGTLTYTFTFRNTGNVSIKNLTVTDGNIDPNTLACNGDGNDDGAIDTIGVGGSQTCTATRAISQPQIDAGTALTNTAIPTAMSPDGITAVAEDDTANDNSTSTSVSQSASYTMAKTSDTPTMNAAGTITYTFTFVNTGNVTLTNLTVLDNDIDANTLSCNGDGDNDDDIDTLGVGITQTCTATRAISKSQIDAGPDIVNTATPSAKGPDGSSTVAENDTANDNSTSTDTLQSPSADDETQHNLVVGTPTIVDVTDGDTDPDGTIDLSTVHLTSNNATDSDNDGDADELIVSGEGVWTVNDATGEITFTPEPGFQNDPTPISYSVKDSDGNTSNVATVVVNYGKPPVADHDAKANLTLGTATDVDVLANDSDADGNLDPATVQILGTSSPGDSLEIPGEGTWSVDTGTGRITFIPETGFIGDPTPIQYTVDDNDGNTSNSVRVTVTYGDAPIAADDTKHNVVAGTPTELDVLANDGDLDGTVDVATVKIVGTTTPGDSLVVAGEGEWSIDLATGKITFTPIPGFYLDPSPIQYTVKDDANNSSNMATVRVTYGERPIASPDGNANLVIGTPTSVDLVGNDNDVDGSVDPTTVKIVDPPAGGTLSADGKILTIPGEGKWEIDATTGVATFTPESGFAGDPTPISYTVEDNDGNVSDPATVTVTYGEPPQATDDNEYNPVIGSVTVIQTVANDNDIDGTLAPATLQIAGTSVAGESLVVSDEGEWMIDPLSGDITFTPENGFTGDPSPIQYTIRDNDSNVSNSATVTVTYGKPPLTENDSKHNPVLGSTTVIDVANNDNDPDGTINLNSVKIVSNPTGSILSADQSSLIVPDEGEWKVISGTGILSFTPEAGFEGNPTPISYTLEDNHGNLSSSASVRVTYGSGPVTGSVAKLNSVVGSSTIISLLDNDSDPDGNLDPSTIQLTGTNNPGDSLVVSGEGEWSINTATGEVTFTPEVGFVGDPTPVFYTVEDNDGNTSNPTMVTVTYGSAPETVDDSKHNLIVSSPTEVDVLSNDSDSDGTLNPASVQIQGTNNPGDSHTVIGQGVWTIDSATGKIIFTPEEGYFDNPTPILYTVRDNDGNISNISTVTVTYEPLTVASIEGLIWLDANKNGLKDDGEEGLSDWFVKIYDSEGTLLYTIQVNDDGTFEQPDLDMGDYNVEFLSPGGLIMQEQSLTLTPLNPVGFAPYPIDPAGIVYDESTGEPVSGARVSLISLATGFELPDVCLGSGEQGQVTGIDGAYSFLLHPGADRACPLDDTIYRLRIIPPADYRLSLSNPPERGVLDSDNCSIDAVPGITCEVSDQSSGPISGTPLYFVMMEIGEADPGIFNNHIPLFSHGVPVPTLSEWARILLIICFAFLLVGHADRFKRRRVS